MHGDLGLDRLVGAHPDEVDVHEGAFGGVALDLASERELLLAVDSEGDQSVRPARPRQDVRELTRRDRDRHALLAEAVDDGRDEALPAQATGRTRASGGAQFGSESGVGHGSSDLRDGGTEREIVAHERRFAAIPRG